MKYITFILVLCSTTLFSQRTIHTEPVYQPITETSGGINIWIDSLGSIQFGTTPVGYSKINWDSVYLDETSGDVLRFKRDKPIISGSGVTFGINTLTIDRPSFTTVTAGKGVRLRALPSGDVIAEIDTAQTSLFITERETYSSTPMVTWTSGYERDTALLLSSNVKATTAITQIIYDDSVPGITLNLDSLKFARDIQLPQAWQDSTVWDAPYDPNLFFHKSHEWVYSEFDDLNQDYQKQFPYPLGGMEYQGRICKVCKTKQQRTIYYGTGKNPFKKIPTNSPYSQLLLQSRQ